MELKYVQIVMEKVCDGKCVIVIPRDYLAINHLNVKWMLKDIWHLYLWTYIEETTLIRNPVP